MTGPKTKPAYYALTVGNESYMGSPHNTYTSEEEAEEAAQDWLRHMLAIDGEAPEDYPEGDHGYEWCITRVDVEVVVEEPSPVVEEPSPITYMHTFPHDVSSRGFCSREQSNVFDLRVTAFGRNLDWTPNIDRHGYVDPAMGEEEFVYAERVARLLADAPAMLDLLREIAEGVKGMEIGGLPEGMSARLADLANKHGED